MRSKPQPTLARRLTFSAISLTIISLIIVTVVIYFSAVTFGDKFMEEELEKQASFLQKAYREPLWSFDQNQLEEITHSILMSSQYINVSAIKIESPDGSILHEAGQGNIKTVNEAKIQNFSKIKKFDVIKEKQLLSKVTIVMNNQGYINSYKSMLLWVLGSSLIALMTFSLFVKSYFDTIFTYPMKKILSQIKNFNDEDYTPKILSDLPMELEKISDALNQAAERIEKKNTDIKYYTSDLENLIHQRTEALRDQMDRNVNSARLAAVGEMAAGVAHEINNPLTVIDLHLKKISRSESKEEINSSTEKILLMIKRISTIIKGLKSLSRDGQLDPLVPFSISSMIEDVKVLTEMKIKSNQILFKCSEFKSDIKVLGKEVQVSQVLVNLIVNAVDAIMMQDDLENKEKWISLEIIEEANEIKFSVTDSGPGIPIELREKIMNPFFTTKGVSKGTGLGLSISKSIIEEHGGKLTLCSETAHTKFQFILKKFTDENEKTA